MNARTEAALSRCPSVHPAHERFKSGERRRWLVSMAVAALVHMLLFAFGPNWVVPEERMAYAPPAAMEAMVLAPAVEIPSPPATIVAPAAPEAARLALPEDIVVEPVAEIVGSIPIPEIPEPPVTAVRERELARYQYFAPYMVRPELLNRNEVRRVLEQRYPNVLRGGHAEGAVLVVFWIDEFGEVQKYEIRQSSGSKALDEAVESVIPMMKFRPAMERGEPVKVIVALPIRFQVR